MPFFNFFRISDEFPNPNLVFQISDEFLLPCKIFFLSENTHEKRELGENVSLRRIIYQYYAIFLVFQVSDESLLPCKHIFLSENFKKRAKKD